MVSDAPSFDLMLHVCEQTVCANFTSMWNSARGIGCPYKMFFLKMKNRRDRNCNGKIIAYENFWGVMGAAKQEPTGRIKECREMSYRGSWDRVCVSKKAAQSEVNWKSCNFPTFATFSNPSSLWSLELWLPHLLTNKVSGVREMKVQQ